MPLGKYYCDYCDKQFQDTASARKRHLLGLQHQRAKALWYDSHSHLKDSNRIQAESFGQGVCNNFVRTGFCQYGDSCKYFHPKQTFHNPNVPPNMVANFNEMVQSPVGLGNQAGSGRTVPADMIRDGMGISLGNLPPSLRPPPEGGYPSLPFLDWG